MDPPAPEMLAAGGHTAALAVALAVLVPSIAANLWLVRKLVALVDLQRESQRLHGRTLDVLSRFATGG